MQENKQPQPSEDHESSSSSIDLALLEKCLREYQSKVIPVSENFSTPVPNFGLPDDTTTKLRNQVQLIINYINKPILTDNLEEILGPEHKNKVHVYRRALRDRHRIIEDAQENKLRVNSLSTVYGALNSIIIYLTPFPAYADILANCEGLKQEIMAFRYDPNYEEENPTEDPYNRHSTQEKIDFANQMYEKLTQLLRDLFALSQNN